MSSSKITTYVCPNVCESYPCDIFYVFKLRGNVLGGVAIPIRCNNLKRAKLELFRVLFSAPRLCNVSAFLFTLNVESVRVDLLKQSVRSAYLYHNSTKLTVTK